MDELELWSWGLLTLGIGPDLEWHPALHGDHQRVHNAFWHMVLGLVPDEEADEPYWMTEAATAELRNN